MRTQQNEHLFKKIELLFREIWLSEPGTGSIAFVSKVRAVCCIYVSGTPIWARIGEKVICGLPLPPNKLKVCSKFAVVKPKL